MGVYTFTGACCVCGKVIIFHPDKVSSYQTSEDAPRRPICEDCVIKINIERKKRNLPPIPHDPAAYNVALDEDKERINWGG